MSERPTPEHGHRGSGAKGVHGDSLVRPQQAGTRQVGVEVITVGECLIALLADPAGAIAEAGNFVPHVAGAEANVAVGLSRLGHQVAFIGRVGADGLGTAVRRRLRGEGVNVDHLAVDPERSTAILIRERRIFGPSEVAYYRAGSAGSALDRSDIERASSLFRSAQWLHLSGITPALSEGAANAVQLAIELARAQRATVSLDLNLRRKLWTEAVAGPVLRLLAERADVVMGSANEVALVTGLDPEAPPSELAQGLIGLGPSLAILKLGSGGALCVERDSSPIHCRGYSTLAVDPIGAGDAFAAGIIAARLEGHPGKRMLEIANACGAAVVSAVGDMSGLLQRHELDRILSESTADSDAIR